MAANFTKLPELLRGPIATPREGITWRVSSRARAWAVFMFIYPIFHSSPGTLMHTVCL